MSVSINYPYTLDSNGVVLPTENPSKIYLDRVLTLLSTSIGQRPMLPTYGVDWSSALFENDNLAQPAISSAIKTAIAKWLPEITVSSINFSGVGNDGIEQVTLGLILPDNTTTSVVVNSNILNYDGTIAG